MDNEKIEATMQFILEQQAQFAARAEETREKDSARTKGLEESFAVLVELTKNHDQGIQNHHDQLASLAEAQIRADQRLIALTEAQIRTEKARERDAAHIKRLEESYAILIQLAKSHNERLESLTEAQIRVDEQLWEAGERSKEADERGRDTDERLNALIAIVERYLSNRDKNGSSNN